MEKVLVQETGCSWRLAHEAIGEAKDSYPGGSPKEDWLLSEAREIITPKLEEDREHQKRRRSSHGSRSGSDTEDENRRRPSYNSKAKMKQSGGSSKNVQKGSSRNLQKGSSKNLQKGAGAAAGASSKNLQKRQSSPKVVSDDEAAEKNGLCPTCGVRTHNVSRFNKEARKNKDVHYGTCVRCNPDDVPPSALKAWKEKEKANPTPSPNAQKDSASPPKKASQQAADPKPERMASQRAASPKPADKAEKKDVWARPSPTKKASARASGPGGTSSRKMGDAAAPAAAGAAIGAAASSSTKNLASDAGGRTSHCDTCGIRTHRGSSLLKVEIKNENVHYGTCIRCNPQSVPPSVLKKWREDQELNPTSPKQDSSKALKGAKSSSPSSSRNMTSSQRGSQRKSQKGSAMQSDVSDAEMTDASAPKRRTSTRTKNYELQLVKETGCSWRLAHDALGEATASKEDGDDDEKILACAKEIITPQLDEDRVKHKASRRPSGSSKGSDVEDEPVMRKSNRALKPVNKSPSARATESPPKPSQTQMYAETDDEDVSNMLAAAAVGGAAGAAGGAAVSSARKKKNNPIAAAPKKTKASSTAAPSTTRAPPPQKAVPDKSSGVSPAAVGTAAAVGVTAAAVAASANDAEPVSPSKSQRGAAPTIRTGVSEERFVDATIPSPVTPLASPPAGEASSPPLRDDGDGFLSRTFDIPAGVSDWLEENFNRDDISVVVLAAASKKPLSSFSKQKKKSSRSSHRRSSHRRKSTGPPPEEVAALRNELHTMKSDMQMLRASMTAHGIDSAAEVDSD